MDATDYFKKQLIKARRNLQHAIERNDQQAVDNILKKIEAYNEAIKSMKNGKDDNDGT